MRELGRVNDPVLVSAVGALLDGASIHYLVLDSNMSVIDGSLGILPRRILVTRTTIWPPRGGAHRCRASRMNCGPRIEPGRTR